MLKTPEECLALLEQIRWGEEPKCPYCNSTNSSAFKKERRYHCHNCFTSYSVTVNTIFHRTRVKLLPKWFQAIQLVMIEPKKVSVRQLATEIGVDKDTAYRMLLEIRRATGEKSELLQQLLKAIK